MSVPSIDPKTVAIGAAVVVAGIGAYILLSEPPMTPEQKKKKEDEKRADDKEAKDLQNIADSDAPLAAKPFLEAGAVAENVFFKMFGGGYTYSSEIQLLVALARQQLAAGQLDAAAGLATQAHYLYNAEIDSNFVSSADQNDPNFWNVAVQQLFDLQNDISDAMLARDQKLAVGSVTQKLDAGTQAANDSAANAAWGHSGANRLATIALTNLASAAVQQATDDESAAYQKIIKQLLDLSPASLYGSVSMGYVTHWGQATYDEKIGSLYHQYYGPYHTYQDKKNSTNPHDLDDAMTALNQLPDWLIGSAERTSFSERRGQAALTAAHISQEDAEKQLSAIFGNLGSAASKLGTVFVKK